jgi:hypothetical protein
MINQDNQTFQVNQLKEAVCLFSHSLFIIDILPQISTFFVAF